MKQHITKEQWDELNTEGKYKMMCHFSERYNLAWIAHIEYTDNPGISIGQMIEFLGDEWVFGVMNCSYCDSVEGYIFPDNDVLCGKLWKAVKYKLGKKRVKK